MTQNPPGGPSPTAQGSICHSPSFAGPSEIAIDILRIKSLSGKNPTRGRRIAKVFWGQLTLALYKKRLVIGTGCRYMCLSPVARVTGSDEVRDMVVADAVSIPGSQRFSTRSVEDLITLFSRGSEKP